MPEAWKTLRVVVELPVLGNGMNERDLRWSVEQSLRDLPPERQFIRTPGHEVRVGRLRVKGHTRVEAAQRDDVFWGNVYGKQEGWALRKRDGKWFFITTDRRKLATDAEAEAWVRARANPDHDAYYDDAVALVDGRA